MNIEKKFSFKPDYAVHPGEILEETLLARGIRKSELAERSGLTAKHISQIINGKSPVTPETAVRLERILDVKAGLWLNLDALYRLAMQKRQERKSLESKYEWANKFPVKELILRGFLPKVVTKSELVESLLDFFNVGTIDAWVEQYGKMEVQFRRTGRHDHSPEAIAAWLKIGENRARDIPTKPFNRELFRNAMKEIRPLTKESPEVFVSKMVQLCAESGVAVVFVREFPGTGINGATYWIGRKALLLLSLRYKYDDHLWFTFFHEAGHIILHGRNRLIVEHEGAHSNQIEEEANNFAADFLIPRPKYEQFIVKNARFDQNIIGRFAKELDIAPGIVVGRLQKDGRLAYSWQNGLKRRFELVE